MVESINYLSKFDDRYTNLINLNPNGSQVRFESIKDHLSDVLFVKINHQSPKAKANLICEGSFGKHQKEAITQPSDADPMNIQTDEQDDDLPNQPQLKLPVVKHLRFADQEYASQSSPEKSDSTTTQKEALKRYFSDMIEAYP